MPRKTRESILTGLTKTLFPFSEPTKQFVLLKDQSPIPFILDTLSRQAHHHLILCGADSAIFQFAFLENIAQHFAEEHIPKTLRDAHFFLLDIQQIILNTVEPDQLEQDFKILCKKLEKENKRIILAINHIAPLFTNNQDNLLNCLNTLIKPLLSNEQWRIIAITDKEVPLSQHAHLQHYFSSLRLSDPTTTDLLALLKTRRDDLEHFHHVLIPDEIFSYTLSLATHYMSGSQTILNKTLQLLDSAAARTSALERNEQTNQFKPIVTQAILANIISSWTRIPLSHLQQNKFKASDFIQNMQKYIFSQESALNLIGLTLQHARLKLHHQTGPLCSFLFAGPPHIGKSTTAYAIAEQLFGHKEALFNVILGKNQFATTLSNIKINTKITGNFSSRLIDAIQQNPYAVILLENIDQTNAHILDLFQDILMHGYGTDEEGNRYDFRHAIFIITTTIGTERLINLAHADTTQESTQTADLMQLVLNEQIAHPTSPHIHLSPQELNEEIFPALEQTFSNTLLRHLNLVPFGLLEQAGLEKIIRLKIKAFAKQLDHHFGIELTFAPEVIRFLIQETLWRGTLTRPIDKILEQHLYPCVAQQLLGQTDDKNKLKRLLLQLNDSGQVLHCEFVSANDATLYTV
jgi:ATP-dependent Clp protease ATP-binding subunit ClpA